MREAGRVIPGYELVMSPPPAEDYLRLRREAGLRPKTADQARGVLAGSWAFCHAVHTGTGEVVGMGRLLGDGGWYFHVADMAVLPSHQRRGLGDAILTVLLDKIRSGAPPGAFVSLFADPAGRRLYQRHGFAVSTASEGMTQVLNTPG
jgi:GNAT superfamily N-acetyltransferase